MASHASTMQVVHRVTCRACQNPLLAGCADLLLVLPGAWQVKWGSQQPLLA